MPSGHYHREKRLLLPCQSDLTTMVVPLARGKGFAVIDVDHATEIGQHNWSLRKPTKRCNTSYAVTHDLTLPGYPTVFLHRLIGRLLGFPEDLEIDHRDGDGLNNRSVNLRPATGTQNRGNIGIPSNNTIGYKGVHQRKDSGKFVAGIIHKQTRRRKHLGTFETAEAAARAYDRAARAYFGEFAAVNFP